MACEFPVSYRLKCISRRTLDYSKLSNADTLSAFNQAIANQYRFAQFYGNTCLAVLLLLVARVAFSPWSWADWNVLLVAVATVVVLFLAHRKQLSDTYATLERILS